MTGTTRLTVWSKSTKTRATTAWRPLLRGVDEGRRCLDRATGLRRVDEGRRCLDRATGLREEGTLASHGCVREVRLRRAILAMQLYAEAVGVNGRGGTVEGRQRRLLVFLMPDYNRYSASAQNHRCSTSPWSIPGYRIFSQGSTMVKSIINRMITILA